MWILREARMKVTRTVSCVAILISTVLALSGISASVSELAPDFSIVDIDGDEFTLSDHRGKVVLIDFMKTECQWCWSMMEELVVIRQNYTEEELVMISISVSDQDTVEDIRDYKLTFNGDWAFAKDDQDLKSIYRISAVPTEYVVDVKGCVHSRIVGYRTWEILAESIDGAKTGCGAPTIPPVEEEMPAYDFTITDTDGNQFQLSDHEGSVVLIDFFIPSGLNSALMHGEIKAIRENFTEQELVIISIGVEAEDNQEIKDFRDDYGGNWTYARDIEELWQQFGVTATPTICVVDVDGNIQFHNVGFLESQEMIHYVEYAKTGDGPSDICRTDIDWLTISVITGGFVVLAIVFIFWGMRRGA